MHKSLFLLAATFGLSACALGPDYQRPDLVLPTRYPHAVQPSTSAGTPATSQHGAPQAISARWWSAYQDAQLDQLIEQALAHNTDIAQAAARIEQSAALDQQARGAQLPSVNGSGAATRSRSSLTTASPGNGVANDLQWAASTAFELDFWGRLRRASEATRAQTLASRYAQEVVQQTVASQTAQYYFAWQASNRQVAFTRHTLESYQAELPLQQSRLQHGTISQLDLEQTEDALAATQQQLQEQLRQRDLQVNQLTLLCGRFSLALSERSGSDQPATQLAPIPTPPSGLPADLLARRPDVRQAEQSLIAANARIGVAEAARLPSLTLTGQGRSESAGLPDLLHDPSRIWSLGVGLYLPLFDGGRRAAAVVQAKATWAEALAAYRGAALSAFKDVADALANQQAANTAHQQAQTREQLAEHSLALTRQRYAAGSSGYSELLGAQRALDSARARQLTSQTDQLDASIALFKALGGGWQAPAQG